MNPIQFKSVPENVMEGVLGLVEEKGLDEAKQFFTDGLKLIGEFREFTETMLGGTAAGFNLPKDLTPEIENAICAFEDAPIPDTHRFFAALLLTAYHSDRTSAKFTAVLKTLETQ